MIEIEKNGSNWGIYLRNFATGIIHFLDKSTMVKWGNLLMNRGLGSSFSLVLYVYFFANNIGKAMAPSLLTYYVLFLKKYLETNALTHQTRIN